MNTALYLINLLKLIYFMCFIVERKLYIIYVIYFSEFNVYYTIMNYVQ